MNLETTKISRKEGTCWDIRVKQEKLQTEIRLLNFQPFATSSEGVFIEETRVFRGRGVG